MKALFDLSFRTFVAPTIAKIVYVIGMIVIALTYLGFVVSAFSEDVLLGLLVLIILGPIVALFYLVFLRVGLEALLAAIFTAQNTTRLVELFGGQPGGGMQFGPPGGPGGPWTSGPTGPPPQQPPGSSGPPPSSQQPGTPPPPPPSSGQTPPPPPPSSGGQGPPPPPPPRSGPDDDRG